MRFTEDPPADGPTNMALDLALLDGGQPACRLYSWTEAWVTLGRFQQASRDLVDPSRVPWIVRPTGGKAVLHGHDWTVGLAAPLDSLASDAWPVEKLSRSVRQVYRALAAPLVAALQACGLNAALGEETRFVGGARVADCFAHVSANDIVEATTGVKVCGCALKLTPNAVLLQASIPRGAPLIPAGEVIRDAEALAYPMWDSQAFPGALGTELSRLPLR